jgi:hypothetical protein
MIDDEKMNELIKKAATDPEWRKVFDAFMVWSQKASQLGWTVEEMASVCMMGYVVGSDPKLQEMVENIAKINNLGLDIIDK